MFRKIYMPQLKQEKRNPPAISRWKNIEGKQCEAKNYTYIRTPRVVRLRGCKKFFSLLFLLRTISQSVLSPLNRIIHSCTFSYIFYFFISPVSLLCSLFVPSYSVNGPSYMYKLSGPPIILSIIVSLAHSLSVFRKHSENTLTNWINFIFIFFCLTEDLALYINVGAGTLLHTATLGLFDSALFLLAHNMHPHFSYKHFVVSLFTHPS